MRITAAGQDGQCGKNGKSRRQPRSGRIEIERVLHGQAIGIQPLDVDPSSEGHRPERVRASHVTGKPPALCREPEETARNRPSGNEGRRADRKGRAKEELPGSRELGRGSTGRCQTIGIRRQREDAHRQRRSEVERDPVESAPGHFPSRGPRRQEALAVRRGMIVRAVLMMAGWGVAVIVMVVIVVDLVDQSEVLQVHVG